MRSFGIRILITLLVFCLAFPAFGVNAAGEAVEITLACNGEAYYGGEITLRISVTKPTSALAGLEFTLAYDAKYVEPLLTKNSEENREMDSLVTAMPSGWEQMSNHTEGLYTFRFAMPDNGKDLLDASGELVLELPFAVRSAGTFSFDVASADIIAVANDSESTPLSGKGNSLSVVADSEAQKLAVDIKGKDTVNEKGTYLLEIETTNLGDASGIVAVEFEFTYDKTVFSPDIIENENEEMNVFMTDMPGDWEQMCSFDESKSRYTLRFAAKNAESASDADALESGEALRVTIPFKVIGSEGDVASFMVDSPSVIGINCINGILTGSGSIKSVSVEKAPASSIPDDIGYIIKDGYLMYVNEKTSVSDFLAPFSSVFSINSKGDTVCTGDVLTDGNTISLTVIVLGDVNGSGDIEKYDYILTKRYCMNTVEFNGTQTFAADANLNGEVEKYDYILIKRHCMGTFAIKGDK